MFTRKCPKCNIILEYSSLTRRNNAEIKQFWCSSCRVTKLNKAKTGQKNPFFGKHHSEETKEKIRQNTDRAYTKTDEFKRKSARVGDQNGMYGKSFYDVWLKKYGIDVANEKLKELSRKQSDNTSGSNNPMYGKPAPKKSGSGISGWYKGWFFRSIKELSFMIFVIEKNNFTWESAETSQFAIPYKDHSGNSRTYRADFIVENKIMVEVKPKRLMNSPSNILKKNAACQFCESHGLEYRMVDVKSIEPEILIEMCDSGMVKITVPEKLEKYRCRLLQK